MGATALNHPGPVDETPEVIIRPRAGGVADRLRVRYVFAALPLAALGVASKLTDAVTDRTWYAVFGVSVVLLALLVRADFFARTSIRITRDRVRRTGYFGRWRSRPLSAVARVVEVGVAGSRLTRSPERWLLFLDDRGRTILRAYAEYYRSAELLRLREALGVPWDRIPEVLTVAETRRELPRAFPWPLAHIWLTSLAGTALAMVVSGMVFGFV